MLATVDTAIIAQLITMVFLAYLAIMFLKGVYNPEKYKFTKPLDEFDLGYVTKRANQGVPSSMLPKPVKQIELPTVNPHVLVQPEPVVPAVAPKKTVKQPVSPLFNDCVLALRSLGYKAGPAKMEVHAKMTNHEFTTVEEFLKVVFSKKKE
jgi:hypothetical protein|tara:strand:- start:297 stop:749 length:453 start_codon:yes stop_codon:yes gene_type:complete